MLRKVVLPEPEGPVTARNSPAFTSSDRSRNACVSIRSVRNTLLMLVIESMDLPRYEHRGCVLVITHVGEHDDVAGIEPVAHFYFADGDRAELHGRAHRLAVACNVDEARVRILEGAARHLEHVLAFVEHDAHRGALVLAQAAGLLGEAHAAG